MKILQITGSLEIGGLENMACNIARYAPSDYTIDFLVYELKGIGYEQEMDSLGSNNFVVTRPSENPVNFLKQYIQLIREQDYDIIHIHTYTSSGYMAFLAKKFTNAKVIVHSHTQGEHKDGFFYQQYTKLMRHLIASSSDVRIAVGELAGKSLFNDDFQIVNNGVDLEAYSFSKEKRQELRDIFQFSDNTKVIGHVGRLSVEKNQLFLLDILKNMLEKSLDVKLVMIGEGDEYYSLLQNKINEYQLEDDVYILDSHSNVMDLYNMFDVIVFPSLYEGVPLVLIESQVNGLPIVASNTIDEKSFVSENVMIHDLNDSIESWIASIVSLERTEPNRSLYKNFSIHSSMDAIYAIYES